MGFTSGGLTQQLGDLRVNSSSVQVGSYVLQNLPENKSWSFVINNTSLNILLTVTC